jgi:hypothetical protein
VQFPAVVVLLAVDRDTLCERGDCLLVDLLEDLAAARVARKGRDEKQRLDLADARDYSPDRNELAEVGAFDFADCERDRVAEGPKVEVAVELAALSARCLLSMY